MSIAVRTDLDQLCVNTIRTLSMDAVQAANSGHPGAPMGLAPVAYCLWQKFLRFDPSLRGRGVGGEGGWGSLQLGAVTRPRER